MEFNAQTIKVKIRTNSLYIPQVNLPSKNNLFHNGKFRSSSEPWLNSWDTKRWTATSDNFNQDEIKDNKYELEKSKIDILSEKRNVFNNDFMQPGTKEEVINALKTKLRKKKIQRRASFIGNPLDSFYFQGVLKQKSHWKRLSLKSEQKERRSSQCLYNHIPKTKENDIVETLIQFTLKHIDNEALIEGIIAMEGAIAPLDLILEGYCKMYFDTKDESTKIMIVNLMGRRVSIFPHLFTSSDQISIVFENFINQLNKSEDTLDYHLYLKLFKIYDKAWTLCHPENNIISINMILDAANTSNIKSFMKKLSSENKSYAKPMLGKKAFMHLAMQYKGRNNLNLLYISPLELARQWTLLDHRLISKLRIDDIILNVKNPKRSVVLTEIADRFNHCTSWVAAQILNVKNTKKRASVIVHLIELCDQLLELKNFQGFLSVIMGINQGPIMRLHSTWKKIPSKSLKLLKHLETIASPINNFGELRRLSEKSSPPLVPAPSIFLKDVLVFLDINGYKFMEKQIIHSDLIILCQKILSPLIISQITPYEFFSIPLIQTFLESQIMMCEDELEMLATKLESKKSFVETNR